MTNNVKHAQNAELQILLDGDEDSDEYRAAVAHVETCELCRERLDTAAGPTEIDTEARELLSDYPWDELTASRSGFQVHGDSRGQRANLSFLSPPSHPEMLGRLGRYEIERVIGSGGMGVVLKAFDTELNRPVAIKVLAQHLAHSGAARQRFARESRSVAAVVHEHVVAIHNVETDDENPFLVMQYVAGESLQARVDRDGPLSAKEILRIGSQVAAGLAAAHEQGVIHRDVKPANILLEKGVERVLLTDFGLARTVDDASLTHTGVVAGTPHYMSPEQCDGQVADERTDLFSLGSVLYFMATGHPPFRAERAMGVLNRICHDQQRPLWQTGNDIPDELSILVDRLLEKRPAKRFDSANAVRERLTSLLAGIQHPRAGFVRRLQRIKHRYPRRTLIAVVFVALFSSVAAWVASRTSGTAKFESPPQSAEEREQSLASPLFDAQESSQFESTITGLNSRLENLGDGGLFVAPETHDRESTLQSIHQRLDRLQRSDFFESHDTQTGEEK